jgi:hypothetical protein
MRRPVRRSPWLAGVLSLTIALPQVVPVSVQTKPAAAATPPPGTNADPGWPRTIALKSGTATWYQPQIESWVNQKQIVAWSAVSYQPAGAKEPALGTIKIEGPTQVAVDDRVVSMDLTVTEYNFTSLKPEQVKALVADVQALPANHKVLDLDRLLAYVDASPLQVHNAESIKADPPRIFHSAAPAILVNCSSTRRPRRCTCATTSRGCRRRRFADPGSRLARCPPVSPGCPPTTTGRR